MATSASARDAHELGGGSGGSAPAREPATTVTSVVRPASSADVTRGIWWSHSMVKYGSTILSAAGRFNQIWKSSQGFGPSRSSSGNISQCTMPSPAVSHCTSPRPNRAVAPSESEWSM